MRSTKELTISEAREQLTSLPEELDRHPGAVAVTRRGKPIIKLVPAHKGMSLEESRAWLEEARKVRERMKPTTSEENLADRHAGHKA